MLRARAKLGKQRGKQVMSQTCVVRYSALSIFLGFLTVQFDLSDNAELLVIGQVKSDSFGVTVAKLS